MKLGGPEVEGQKETRHDFWAVKGGGEPLDFRTKDTYAGENVG